VRIKVAWEAERVQVMNGSFDAPGSPHHPPGRSRPICLSQLEHSCRPAAVIGGTGSACLLVRAPTTIGEIPVSAQPGVRHLRDPSEMKPSFTREHRPDALAPLAETASEHTAQSTRNQCAAIRFAFSCPPLRVPICAADRSGTCPRSPQLGVVQLAAVGEMILLSRPTGLPVSRRTCGR